MFTAHDHVASARPAAGAPSRLARQRLWRWCAYAVLAGAVSLGLLVAAI
jgi:hypothetical protein